MTALEKILNITQGLCVLFLIIFVLDRECHNEKTDQINYTAPVISHSLFNIEVTYQQTTVKNTLQADVYDNKRIVIENGDIKYWTQTAHLTLCSGARSFRIIDK